VTFVLEHIGLLAGDSPVVTDVSVAFEAGTMNVLLGLTLSGDGRPGQADGQAHPFRIA
jgi:hypothetical protein